MLVSGLTSDLVKPLCVYVVNAAVAYDCKFIEENYILVIYNNLHQFHMEVIINHQDVMFLCKFSVVGHGGVDHRYTKWFYQITCES